MSLHMHYYGDPALRKYGASVKKIDKETREFVEQMKAFIQELDASSHYAVGLAAPQVGKAVRIFLVRLYDIDKEGKITFHPPKVYINPKLTNPSKEKEVMTEGCLSFPNLHLDIERPYSITVEAQNLEGETFVEHLFGFPARVVMHENDHINGKLFIDHISKKQKKEIQPILQKIQQKASLK